MKRATTSPGGLSRLRLDRETLKQLSRDEMKGAAGGGPHVTWLAGHTCRCTTSDLNPLCWFVKSQNDPR